MGRGRRCNPACLVQHGTTVAIIERADMPSPKLSKSMPVVTSIREAPGREEDVYGWLLSQARELRSHKPNFLDWSGLAEELDELVALAKSQVVSRCSQILAHLLKWQFQTTRRAEKSWRSTIIRERLT